MNGINPMRATAQRARTQSRPYDSRLSRSFAPLAIFALTLALYIRTTGPTLGGVFDSEEFQHAAYTLGVAHAPGYPLYLILGKIFTTLVPIGNVAYRMNLLSAFLGAGAATMVFLVAQHLTRNRVIALITAALFATNAAVWRQAGVASVAPLNFLLTAALVYALLLRRDQRVALGVPAFLFGLNFTHHYSVILLAPAIVLFVILVMRQLVQDGLQSPISTRSAQSPTSNNEIASSQQPPLAMTRSVARAALFAALPLLLYLYIPLRGSDEIRANPLGAIISQIFGTGASATGYVRATLPDILNGLGGVLVYLNDSLTIIGALIVAIGALSAMRAKKDGAAENRATPPPSRPASATVQPAEAGLVMTRRDFNRREQTPLQDAPTLLFLALATLAYFALGVLYGGEPDRYLSLPFFFLIFWFALGANAVGNFIAFYVSRFSLFASRFSLFTPRFTLFAFYFSLFAFLALPFPSRFATADWSTFDRVYKQWDEIFSLPLPRDATIVGNWGQINAMYYLQRVENRRADLRVVGTLYDDAPQTRAAEDAFSAGRAIFLAPGIAPPRGEYRYALLGSLLEIRNAPQFARPVPARALVNAKLNSFLTLADYELSIALEPYRPQSNIRIQPSRTVRVSVTWYVHNSPNHFFAWLRLYDPEGRLVASSQLAPLRGLEHASRWQIGEFVGDVYNFQIPPGSPPGQYELQLGIMDAVSKEPGEQDYGLAALSVERMTTLLREQIFILRRADIAIDSRLALWGYGAPPTVRAGESLSFNLLWAALDNVNADVDLEIALMDASGNIAAQTRGTLIAFYPTRVWQAGEKLKAYYDLRVPSDLQTGEYALVIVVSNKHIPLGQIQVTR